MVYNRLLSANASRVIEYLFRRFDELLNLRELARRLKITPMGIRKILGKLEQEGIVTKQKISNGVFYRINFRNSKTEDIVKYVLKSQQPPNPFASVRSEDLKRLQSIVSAAALFGSVLRQGEKANDVDVLLVFPQAKYKAVQEQVRAVEGLSTKPIHVMMQTPEDLRKNLHKPDQVIREILQTGYILWGYDLLYGMVKHEAESR